MLDYPAPVLQDLPWLVPQDAHLALFIQGSLPSWLDSRVKSILFESSSSCSRRFVTWWESRGQTRQSGSFQGVPCVYRASEVAQTCEEPFNSSYHAITGYLFLFSFLSLLLPQINLPHLHHTSLDFSFAQDNCDWDLALGCVGASGSRLTNERVSLASRP